VARQEHKTVGEDAIGGVGHVGSMPRTITLALSRERAGAQAYAA
jgi:hypothetical protein